MVRKILFFTLLLMQVQTVISAPLIEDRLIPVDWQQKRYSFLEGMPAILLYEARKLNDEKIDNLILELELPACLALVGADSTNPVRNSKTSFKGDVIRKTKEGIYQIVLDQAFVSKLSKSYHWMNYERIYLKALPGTQNSRGAVTYRLLSDGRCLKKGVFTFTVLPPLPDNRKVCRNFDTIIASPLSFESTSEEVYQKYALFWKSLVKKPYAFCFQHRIWKDYSPVLQKRFLNIFEPVCFIGGTSSGPGLRKLISDKRLADSFPQALNADGKKTTSQFPALSPVYLLSAESEVYWNKILIEELHDYFAEGTKWFVWDYEPGAAYGYEKENRALFAKELKLSHVPSAREINTSYASQWFQFRVRQHAQIIRKFCQTLRKNIPGCKIALCTDPLQTRGSRISNWNAVDSRLSDADVDMFMNMPYVAGRQFYDLAVLNNSLLSKPNFPLINPTQNFQMYYERYNPETILQNIVIAAVTGCRGIGFWPYDHFDGRYLEAIAKGFETVAYVEKYYTRKAVNSRLKAEICNISKITFTQNGRKRELVFPDFSQNLVAQLHENGNDIVLTVFNFHPQQKAIVKAVIKDYQGTKGLFDLISGSRYPDADPSDGFLFTLPPNGTAVFVNRIMDGMRTESARYITQNKLKKELAEEMANKKSFAFTPVSRENVSIDFSIISSQDRPALRLNNGRGAFFVDWGNTTGGCWKMRYHDDLLLSGQEHGMIGEISFNDRNQVSPFTGTYAGASIRNGIAAVAFSGTVGSYPGANPLPNPLEGLKIEKSFALLKDGDSVSVRLCLQNRSPRKETMPLDLRIRNILFPGRHIPKTTSHLSCGSVDIPYGESTFGAEATALAVKRQFPWDGKSPVRLTVSNRYFQESAEILPVENIDGFYVWSSPAVHTMEVLICRSLKYGESIQAEFIVRRSPLTKCNAGYQAQTRNLALGARCIYSPQPNYKGCDGPGAETRLTDGVFARHPMIWLRKETVGWSLVANPEFVMDLGKVQKIKHIRYHLANGISNVRWPRAITVEGSRDNRSFTVLGDFLKTNQEQMLAYGVLVNTFLDLDVTGSWRYLRFRIPEGHIHFLDEIEVY